MRVARGRTGQGEQGQHLRVECAQRRGCPAVFERAHRKAAAGRAPHRLDEAACLRRSPVPARITRELCELGEGGDEIRVVLRGFPACRGRVGFRAMQTAAEAAGATRIEPRHQPVAQLHRCLHVLVPGALVAECNQRQQCPAEIAAVAAGLVDILEPALLAGIPPAAGTRAHGIQWPGDVGVAQAPVAPAAVMPLHVQQSRADASCQCGFVAAEQCDGGEGVVVGEGDIDECRHARLGPAWQESISPQTPGLGSQALAGRGCGSRDGCVRKADAQGRDGEQ